MLQNLSHWVNFEAQRFQGAGTQEGHRHIHGAHENAALTVQKPDVATTRGTVARLLSASTTSERTGRLIPSSAAGSGGRNV